MSIKQLKWVFCLFLAYGSAATANQPEVTLKGVVVTLDGLDAEKASTLPSVEVSIRGEKLQRIVVTDLEGRFSFRVPPGRYNLSFALAGFYPLVLEDVSVEREPVQGLLVALTPRVSSESHPLVKRPSLVPAPSLEVAFELVQAAAARRALGIVRITNTGKKPLALPLAPWSGGDAPLGALRMNIALTGHLESPKDAPRLAFNGWYHCIPAQSDCETLQPGTSVQIRVPLFTQNSLGSPTPEVVEFDEAGTLTGRLSLDLILPAQSPETKTVHRTQPVIAEFRIEVPN